MITAIAIFFIGIQVLIFIAALATAWRIGRILSITDPRNTEPLSACPPGMCSSSPNCADRQCPGHPCQQPESPKA